MEVEGIAPAPVSLIVLDLPSVAAPQADCGVDVLAGRPAVVEFDDDGS